MTALDIPTTGTVQADCIGNAPVLSSKGLEKKEPGFYSYAFDDSMLLHCVKWLDNCDTYTVTLPLHQAISTRFCWALVQSQEKEDINSSITSDKNCITMLRAE